MESLFGKPWDSRVFGSLPCVTSLSMLATRKNPILINREGCFLNVKITGEA